jgi:hypothetical protein
MRLVWFLLLLFFVGTILGLEFRENYIKLKLDYVGRRNWVIKLPDEERGLLFLGPLIRECEEIVENGCVLPAIKAALLSNTFTRTGSTLLNTNVVARLLYPQNMMEVIVTVVTVVLATFVALTIYASWQRREIVDHMKFNFQDLKESIAKAKAEVSQVTKQ